MKLFMLLLGCKPAGRRTEQHDIFFGIAETLRDLIPEIIEYWPEAKENIHIDAWREVNNVDGYEVKVIDKKDKHGDVEDVPKLFFLNLGGYRQNEFEEFHYKMLLACSNKAEAMRKARLTAFYKHTGFWEAPSHIDDKYGIDVDDIFEIEDVLDNKIKSSYNILLTTGTSEKEDIINLGYYVLDKL